MSIPFVTLKTVESNMDKKRNMVNISQQNYDEVVEIAAQMGGTNTAMLNGILRQGLNYVRANGFQLEQNVPKKPIIDANLLINSAQKAAKNGQNALRDFLRGITPQEEQRLKYDLKALREAAFDADKAAALVDIDEVREHGNELCLTLNIDEFNAWWANKNEHMQQALDADYANWIKDVNRADHAQKHLGSRPTKRQFGSKIIKNVVPKDDEKAFEAEEKTWMEGLEVAPDIHSE